MNYGPHKAYWWPDEKAVLLRKALAHLESHPRRSRLPGSPGPSGVATSTSMTIGIIITYDEQSYFDIVDVEELADLAYILSRVQIITEQ
jgi:hypothetical protein